MLLNKIAQECGGPICRACIRTRYGLDLRRRDCKYMPGRGICPNCGERKHIVEGLYLSGHLKAIFRRKPVEAAHPDRTESPAPAETSAEPAGIEIPADVENPPAKEPADENPGGDGQ